MSLENQNSISKAAESADARINVKKEDITARQKEALARAEADVTGKIADYKRDKSYEQIKATYIRINNGKDPESELATIQRYFDSQKAAEDEALGLSLQQNASATITKLAELSAEIARERSTILRAEEDYDEHMAEVFGDEYLKTPTEIVAAIDNFGEILGKQPSEKLEQYNVESENMMVELRKNPSKYITAKVEFKYLTDVDLGSISTIIRDLLLSTKEKVKNLDPISKMREFTKAYEKALNLEKMRNEVLTRVLFNEEHEKVVDGLSNTLSKGKETVTEAMELTEEEIAVMLSLAKEALNEEKFMNANVGYDYWHEKITGEAPGQYNTAERIAVEGVAQGLGSAAEGFVHLVSDIPGTIAHLAHGAASLLSADTRRYIAVMLKQGWENTSPLDKAVIATRITTEFLSSGGFVKVLTATAKSEKVARALGKVSRVGRVVGVAGAMKIAKYLNPIFEKVPNLTRYGTKGLEIAYSIGSRVLAVKSKISHFTHKHHKAVHLTQHLATEAFHAAEIAQKQVVDVAEKAHLSAGKNTPTYEELLSVKKDIESAIAYAGNLGLTPTDVKYLQEMLKEVNALSN